MRVILSLFALFLSAPVALAAESWPGPYAGEVVRVIDGDTVVVRLNEGPCGVGPCAGSVWSIRLRGVDTPEKKLCGAGNRSQSCAWCPAEKEAAGRAKALTSKLAVKGAEVRISALSRDPYWGRMVGIVSVRQDGAWMSISDVLIGDGLAVPYDPGAAGSYTKVKPWCPK